MRRGTAVAMAVLGLAGLPAGCGPLPPGSEPVPLVDHGGAPATPDWRGLGGMGDPDANAGMGIGGGVQAGGGPALP